jgi:hypothetical protein
LENWINREGHKIQWAFSCPYPMEVGKEIEMIFCLMYMVFSPFGGIKISQFVEAQWLPWEQKRGKKCFR